MNFIDSLYIYESIKIITISINSLAVYDPQGKNLNIIKTKIHLHYKYGGRTITEFYERLLREGKICEVHNLTKKEIFILYTLCPFTTLDCPHRFGTLVQLPSIL